jgi:hypothetical protein
LAAQKSFFAALMCCLALGPAPRALAWTDHARATYFALRDATLPGQLQSVKVESLDDFLRAEEPAIAKLLAEQEAWASAYFSDYPRRPADLSFSAAPDRDYKARRLAFAHALRISPDAPFALYLVADLPPDAVPAGLTSLPYAAVSTLPASGETPPLVALTPGGEVPALAVVASAADEPDNGLDINCWNDSPGDWGKTYGLGALPFGNPALAFSTQAPFHMGFHHESPTLMYLWPALKRTYPQLRYHQFATLAALAFQTGHAYWGWRFAGIALHYVQDGTQPNHARALANTSTVKVLGFHVIAMAGYPKFERDMIALASNRHMVLERYTSQLLQAEQAGAGSVLIGALSRANPEADSMAWPDRAMEDVVTAESAAVADSLDTLIAETMPANYVTDPDFDFDPATVRPDLIAAVAEAPAGARTQLNGLISERFESFGGHTRRALRAILRAGEARTSN